jgi:hypothetical protein
MSHTARTNMGRWVGMLAIVAALATGSASAAMTQVRFDIPQPFEVGGRVFSAGVITIHELGDYTPSRVLLEVWVDGTCIGIVTAGTADSGSPVKRDEALFRRGEGGRLVMTGYRVAGRPVARTYRFQTPVELAQEGGAGGAVALRIGTR